MARLFIYSEGTKNGDRDQSMIKCFHGYSTMEPASAFIFHPNTKRYGYPSWETSTSCPISRQQMNKDVKPTRAQAVGYNSHCERDGRLGFFSQRLRNMPRMRPARLCPSLPLIGTSDSAALVVSLGKEGAALLCVSGTQGRK